MLERVRLMKGTISIDAKPHGGTTIHVRAPLTVAASENDGHFHRRRRRRVLSDVPAIW
jgi:hypothetical protein